MADWTTDVTSPLFVPPKMIDENARMAPIRMKLFMFGLDILMYLCAQIKHTERRWIKSRRRGDTKWTGSARCDDNDGCSGKTEQYYLKHVCRFCICRTSYRPPQSCGGFRLNASLLQDMQGFWIACLYHAVLRYELVLEAGLGKRKVIEFTARHREFHASVFKRPSI